MGAVVEICGKKTDDMLSVREAAVMLGAGVSTINKYVATGKIKACKIPGSKAHYIRLDELNDFEQNGSLKTRSRKKTLEKKENRMIQILESMDNEQQKALLAAVGSVARLMMMHLNDDQLGMAKATLEATIDGSLTFDILVNAPELMEVQ